VRRIGQEHADMSHDECAPDSGVAPRRRSNLPCSLSSTIWMRTSSERMDVVSCLISGPDDTPYASGLFLFDILFPGDYPSGPPKVNLQTTGSGTVRFNPNLYNCGKVCLSLLGTWSGTQGESWSEQSSTLLQVLVSIQSLILVEEPYFNEPGYETIYNSASGRLQSRQYNESRRVATIQYGMIDYLRQILVPKLAPAGSSCSGGAGAESPPLRRSGHHGAEFEDVVRRHFTLRREAILEQVHRWQREAIQSTQTAPAASSYAAVTAQSAVAAAHTTQVTDLMAPGPRPLSHHLVALNAQVKILEELLAML
jgi:ubiquitin-protein ligase